MTSTPIALRNAHVEARFDAESGRLVHLSGPGGPPLVTDSLCAFWGGETWFSEGSVEDAQPFETVSVNVASNAVEATIRSPWIEITRRFELPEDGPLLKAAFTIRATDKAGPISGVAFPRVRFAADFADAFEDEEDLYFDGAELRDGRQLPCWRVFFKEGHREGLLLVTRSKADMSRFQITERGFDIRPQYMPAYDTALDRPPFPPGETRVVRFEIGPWRVENHEALVEAAELDRPVRVTPAGAPAPGGPPPREPAGVVFDATEFADNDAVEDDYTPDKWMVAEHPCYRGGKALIAQPGVQAPEITLDPGLEGAYRVYVGIGPGDGVTLRLSDDAMATFRIPTCKTNATPFYLRLSGPQPAREVLFRVADMTGRALTLSRFPNSYAATVIDYVRFEKLTPDEEAEEKARRSREPCIELSGFNDVPDIAKFTDACDPDVLAYRANLWEHANAGVRKVLWRIDGQCSDYPSKVNTMRYVCARVHGIFTPQAKAYGRALKKTDMLALAVEAAREYGLTLYGWQRFNSYSSNVQSDFFKDHPEFHEVYANGRPAPKLCLAFPEVRRHKIDILVEAASYGLDGLCLGFLRHPPILLYAPILVETYKAEYGVEPPAADASDPHHRFSFPPDDEENRRWFRHRADYMTTFGRELRAALAGEGLGHVKVAMWIRPNHALFYGIDMEAWLDESLCDEVVADQYVDAEHSQVRPEWKRMVQAKARLIRGVTGFDIAQAREMIPRILGEGYDGLCTYESDFTVVQPEWREIYDSLRR